MNTNKYFLSKRIHWIHGCLYFYSLFYFIHNTHGIIIKNHSLNNTKSVIGEGSNTSISVNGSSREARRSVVSGGFWTIVSFENVPCNATSGDTGICYSTRECTNLGGTPLGSCAGNYGVCCVVMKTCGSTITMNNTYFVNPGYPATTSGPLVCTVTINKLTSANQLYLEMQNFMILGPSTGSCTNDSFTVTVMGSTSTTSYPILCGNNTGQMEYIDLSTASGPVTLTFKLAAGSDPRSWKIRLMEFKTNDFCSAPAGCNQYYRDLMGTIESYNFNGGTGQLLNNYCTKICFQNHPGYCNVLLSEGTFMLPGIAPSVCTTDYIMINNSKFCGDTLNNGMVQMNQTSPYNSILYCSGTAHPDMDIGYSLNYNFLPCTSTGR